MYNNHTTNIKELIYGVSFVEFSKNYNLEVV